MNVASLRLELMQQDGVAFAVQAHIALEGDALALEVGHEARFTTRTSSPRWTNCGMSLLLDPATVPEQKLLRITFFLLRPNDSPHDTGHGGNHENDPDDHVKWSISAVAPTVHHPL